MFHPSQWSSIESKASVVNGKAYQGIAKTNAKNWREANAGSMMDHCQSGWSIVDPEFNQPVMDMCDVTHPIFNPSIHLCRIYVL